MTACTGLLPDDTITWTNMISHWLGYVAYTWEQFHSECPIYLDLYDEFENHASRTEINFNT